MLLVAIPAQSGSAGAQAAPVSTMPSATLALTFSTACSSLPKLVSFPGHLKSLPNQGPFVQFLERITQNAFDYLVNDQGCKWRPCSAGPKESEGEEHGETLAALV